MKQFTINSFYERVREDLINIGFEEGVILKDNSAIIFYKENRKYKLNINCGQSKEKRFYISSLYSRNIIFNEVNGILFKYLECEGNQDHTVYNLPNYQFFEEELNILNKKVIDTEEDYKEAIGIVIEYIEQRIFPFFESIQSIEDVNEKILNQVSWDSYSDYISGAYALKALIIKYLCKSDDFERYKQYMDEIGLRDFNNPDFEQYKPMMLKIEAIEKNVYLYLKGM